MTSQLALDFAPAPPARTGRERKAAALARLQGGNARWLAAVRTEAVRMAWAHGSVTADDLAEHVEWLRVYRGLVPTSSNAMGAVFSTREWEWTGRWIRSERAHMHATDLRVWQLRAP